MAAHGSRVARPFLAGNSIRHGLSRRFWRPVPLRLAAGRSVGGIPGVYCPIARRSAHPYSSRVTNEYSAIDAAMGPGKPFFGKRPAPWRAGETLGDIIRGWRSSARVGRHIVWHHEVEARPADTLPIPKNVPAGVRRSLLARGINRLYRHQGDSLKLVDAGHDVIIATPTASGKSLCYNLPILTTLNAEAKACALYLFPTKALARDQEQALHGLLADAGLEHGAITYDGDTPGDARRSARARGGLVLTNPDMLHAGILPHHTAWARFFSNLRFVVVDELHTYRGVFGSHLANVIRRLLRIARFYNATPQFLFTSATIGNPAAHAASMLGRPVQLVGTSGAASGMRTVMVYNPPVVNAEIGVRESYLKATVKLTADLVCARIPTLVFGQSRNNVEVMLKYLRDRLVPEGIDPEAIVAYRGGYLPGTRRRIEEGLRQGRMACVVATNALELGIDIGGLDAVVCAGYPGSMAALWQRFGRGGRRGKPSLALLVTSSAPLDQYFAGRPESLIATPVEHARIDPDNVEILVQHLKCAAFELPMTQGEAFGDLPVDSVRDGLDYLAEHRLLYLADGGAGRPEGEAAAEDPPPSRVYHWASDSYPAANVSLRAVGWDNFVVINLASTEGETIAEMDWRSTHTMLHEQAIYQHEGRQFQVERLDFDNHKAFVRPVESDYFTTAQTHTVVSVLERHEQASLSFDFNVDCGRGEVSVVEKVVGYKKIKYHTHENIGYGDVRLPEMQMHTSVAWFRFSPGLIDSMALQCPRPLIVDALRGFGRALHIVAAVGLMIDPRDLGFALGDEQGTVGAHGPLPFEPTLYLFDRIPGGVGLSPRIFEERGAVLQRGVELVRRCDCAAGCPACIGPEVGLDDEALDGTRSRSAADDRGLLRRKPVLLHLLARLGAWAG